MERYEPRKIEESGNVDADLAHEHSEKGTSDVPIVPALRQEADHEGCGESSHKVSARWADEDRETGTVAGEYWEPQGPPEKVEELGCRPALRAQEKTGEQKCEGLARDGDRREEKADLDLGCEGREEGHPESGS